MYLKLSSIAAALLLLPSVVMASEIKEKDTFDYTKPLYCKYPHF